MERSGCQFLRPNQQTQTNPSLWCSSSSHLIVVIRRRKGRSPVRNPPIHSRLSSPPPLLARCVSVRKIVRQTEIFFCMCAFSLLRHHPCCSASLGRGCCHAKAQRRASTWQGSPEKRSSGLPSSRHASPGCRARCAACETGAGAGILPIQITSSSSITYPWW